MELFPGLPADVGLQCLITTTSPPFVSVGDSRLCPHYSGRSECLVIMSQASSDPTRKAGSTKRWYAPVYRLTLFEPETGDWHELPPVPDHRNGLPMFCQLVGVGYNLVVMGGWSPSTWMATNTVFIYSFLSGTWRGGADMPGVSISFFPVASDDDRNVFVAGGHDDTKNALKSAMIYDVEFDTWTLLPDMAEERDECKAIFHRGKFNKQGGFEKTAETFNVVNWKWDPVEDEFLESATCPGTCVGDGDGSLYTCHSEKVLARCGGAPWQVIAALPLEVMKTCQVIVSIYN